MPINAEQKRFLTDRLNSARPSMPDEYSTPKIKEPLAVKAARATVRKSQSIINRYNRHLHNIRDRRNEKINDAYNKCKEALLFGDAKSALKIIEKFEKTKF